MEVLAVANQKGGVGKTALTANLAAVAARRGIRVLAIDADPQAALTRQLTRGNFDLGLADVLDGNNELRDAVLAAPSGGPDLVPASRALADVEMGLVTAIRREERLARSMATLDGYDVALIDCPPNLGTITVNALAAADRIIVPVSAEDEGAVRGVGELLLTITEIYGDQRQPDSIAVLTKWDRRREAAGAVERALPKYGIPVAATRIPSSAVHHKAPIWGEPVAQRKPDSTSGTAYSTLLDDLKLAKVTR